MNRRGFLGLLSGAIAVAATGITPAPAVPAEYASGEVGRVSGFDVLTTPITCDARHLYSFDVINGRWWHRIDVIAGTTQWGVDMVAAGAELNADRELAPALAALERVLGERGYVVGRVFKYSREEWTRDHAAQIDWRNRQLEAFNS